MVPASASLTLFMDGLRSLGFQPAKLPDRSDCVVFDNLVESGRFAGKAVRLGFIVPADFPNTPPTGPHVSRIFIRFARAVYIRPAGSINNTLFPFKLKLEGSGSIGRDPFLAGQRNERRSLFT
jgi:hypothetical protein